MNRVSSISRPLLVMLGGMILLLVAATCFLYSQNRAFRQHNRRLIIQNDSVLSVNLQLQQARSREAAARDKKASLSFNTPYKK